MTLIGCLALLGVIALSAGPNNALEGKLEQPSLSFGTATISLGMTAEKVEQRLAAAGRHLQFLSDKKTAIVHLDGEHGGDTEGQVTFSGGRAIYAQFQMPDAHSADALAQEIAGAVDGMVKKACTISNYSAHGTGGGFSQSTFECGSRTFNVMTVQALGSSVRTTNVNIEIGQHH